MIWTTKEINQVIRLRKAGCTTPEVAAMLGIPESRAKGYISVLVAQGKIPCIDELPAPRYFPEAVDRKTRLLINHVMDWVWVHPGTHFKISHQRADDSKWFTFRREDKGGILRDVGIGNNYHWSDAPCTAENLQKLIAMLKLIDTEEKS